MLISELNVASRSLYLFQPPYDCLAPVATTWLPGPDAPEGEAVVWCMGSTRDPGVEFAALAGRSHGLALIMVLPPPDELEPVREYLASLYALRPKAVLPHVAIDAVSALRAVLYAPPASIGVSLGNYLAGRGVLPDDDTRAWVCRIFDLAPEVRSVTRLSSMLCMSRRTLGRHFAEAGLPVPSHWLQFARLLHAVFQLQRNGTSVFHVASKLGYPDGFTLSNQMKRILDLRPSEVRGVLGWEWVVERWLRREKRSDQIKDGKTRSLEP